MRFGYSVSFKISFEFWLKFGWLLYFLTSINEHVSPQSEFVASLFLTLHKFRVSPSSMFEVGAMEANALLIRPGERTVASLFLNKHL